LPHSQEPVVLAGYLRDYLRAALRGCQQIRLNLRQRAHGQAKQRSDNGGGELPAAQGIAAGAAQQAGKDLGKAR
jgi:hypothetical protein